MRSLTLNTTLAKTLIQEGIDIKSVMIYLEKILALPDYTDDSQKKKQRIEAVRFLGTLKELEEECPWAIITHETLPNSEAAILANIVKVIRLLS